MSTERLKAIKERFKSISDGPSTGPWFHDDMGLFVWNGTEDVMRMHIADIRGWGYLTGKGHGALGISRDKAVEIQVANAAFISNSITDVLFLIEEVERLTELTQHLGACEDCHTEHVSTVECKDDHIRALEAELNIARSTLIRLGYSYHEKSLSNAEASYWIPPPEIFHV